MCPGLQVGRFVLVGGNLLVIFARRLQVTDPPGGQTEYLAGAVTPRLAGCGEIADAVEGQAKPGTTYELGGPEVKTFRECMELMLREIDRKRLLMPLPFPLASAAAAVLQYLPGQLLTPDQVRQLRIDNVVSEAARRERRTLAGLGIEPTSLAAILPSYLVRFRPRGQFERRHLA